MCGLAGLFDPENKLSNSELLAVVTRMGETLVARGPDDQGAWADETTGIALSHRRLAIIDLSPEGHQPMRSACGRYVIVFNGEIYNFQVIRSELEELGHRFRGHSDTEVMLAAITQWGLTGAVPRFNGMFAFALWDIKNRQLSLARDRIGKKPLYYGRQGHAFLFASELKALKAYPGFEVGVNRDALALYMRYNYIPAPYSIYRGIYKLLPGTILIISHEQLRQGEPVNPHSGPVPYWSALDAMEEGSRNPFQGSDDQAVAELEHLLRDAVGLRMIADVPIGAFFSGGIDSSTVVALMQAQSDRPVKTFTIGFDVPEYNEAVHARAVAAHLGTEHTELYVTPAQAMAVIPKLPEIYDEVFADSSQIPAFLISQLTRRFVTVSLSGDGGDELFYGYPSYQNAIIRWNRTKIVPHSLRARFAGLRKRSPQDWDDFLERYTSRLPHAFRDKISGHRIVNLLDSLALNGPDELFFFFLSRCREPETLVLHSREPRTVYQDLSLRARIPDVMERMMFMDLVGYLPDDILVKVDRASMAASLESRAPLLDYRVVEFSKRLPPALKLRHGESKWLLRQVLYQYVPRRLIDRQKTGFSVPLGAWLRGSLRDWAEGLLEEKKINEDGFLDYPLVAQTWREHLSGARDQSDFLWTILMFQAWRERWV